MTLDSVVGSIDQELSLLRLRFRGRGWTFWHGGSTGQYWAAHTGRMVLLSGDNAAELAGEIRRVTGEVEPRLHRAPLSGTRVPRVPAPRRPSPRSAGGRESGGRARHRMSGRQARWVRELTAWPRLRSPV